MIAPDSAATTIHRHEPDCLVDEAQLAAIACLARYSGRTLDAYRQDLRGFFQGAVNMPCWRLPARTSSFTAARSRSAGWLPP